MASWISEVLLLVQAHPGWAGVAAGLLAYGESLVVLGAIIPATPALFLLGTLLGSGRLDPVAVVPWIVAGAVCGYWTSWRLGRLMGRRVYASRPLKANRRAVARTRLFFRRFGGLSLVGGRYVLGPLQSLLPLVAGAAGMGTRRFLFWNGASASLWTVVVLSPGFLAARGVRLFGLSADQQQTVVFSLLAISGMLVALTVGITAVRLLRLAVATRRS